MAAITDLAAASSVAAADNLVINQSGTDKKVTKAVLLASTVPVSPTAISMAANTVITLASQTALTFGIMFVTESNTGHSGIFAIRGGYNNVVEIAESGTGFTITKDAAGSVNIYYDTGYKIQNKTAATVSLYMTIIGV